MKQKFHIITRCTRQENLLTIYENIFNNWYDITWHIIFDCYRIKNLEAETLFKIQGEKVKLYYSFSTKDDYLYPQTHLALNKIIDGYVLFIDDDNIVHENYFDEIVKYINDDHKIYVVDQYVGGKDFTGLDVRIASKDNNKLKGVDVGQLTFHISVFKKYRFSEGYQADGNLIEEIMKSNPEWFFYINKTLSYYNYIIPKENNFYLPRILLIGNENKELQTNYNNEEIENKLNVIWKPTDHDISKVICEYDPNSIILISDDYKKYNELCNQPINTRNKWITLNNIDENTGQIAYDLAMNAMLKNDNNKLISFFTSAYNCGEKIISLYNTLLKQTYTNWEFVIVNDSTDGGFTQKRIENIAKYDQRVKVYEFSNKTKGIIGEAKYRAAMLCDGELLAEVDHDDLLVEYCAEVIMKASEMYHDAGFFYSDCLELYSETEKSVKYNEGFACGYGSYKNYEWNGKIYEVQNTPNINPKTIRHIVGVPNHIRVWRKSFYHSINGHNRNLSIADDYEIIVRTFLNTRMVKIPIVTYIQNLHNSNSQDKTRKDIQRRVRSIMYYYNEEIYERFKELGVEDWAYIENKYDPLDTRTRYGKEENYVNYIFQIN